MCIMLNRESTFGVVEAALFNTDIKVQMITRWGLLVRVGQQEEMDINDR